MENSMKGSKDRMELWMAVAFAAGLAVSASYGQMDNQTQVVDGVTWTYSVTKGTASITGAGSARGDLAIPSSLGTYPVTRIGDHMSWDYTSFFPTAVTIPFSVTNIGDSAFVNCVNLTQILVDSGNKYFASKDGVLFTKSGDG